MRRREFIALVGGVVAWPTTMNAQQPSTPLVGFMSGRSPEESAHLVAAFHQGLQELGFTEGQNVTIEYRWARGDFSRLSALAADLVTRRVNVLSSVGGTPSARAAKAATSTIPIVFATGGDPVEDGLVESFNRPGGNATGYAILTNLIEPKRLGLLQELVPNVGVYGALLNPSSADATRQLQELEEAASKIGKRIFAAFAGNDPEVDAALGALSREQVGALLVAANAYFDTRRRRLIALAAQYRIPALYHFREYVVDGGLISYGPSAIEAYRQIGIYVGRILRGASPSDLPVVQPTKFEFVVNLKTAKALGLAIPQAILLRADEVIE
jgi:putative ABC transport system substrate-binding protein